MNHPFFKFFFIFFLLLIFINLVVLDIKMFEALKKNNSSNSQKNNFKVSEKIVEDKKDLEEKIPETESLCPNSCIGKISEATESFKTLQSQINNLSKQKQTSSNQVQQVVNTQSQVKEYFVTFGSGSNNTDDWSDVTGLQVYVNSSQYGKIKDVTFEASMRIPTGNEVAYARLYNVTDKHPVWFSEVSLEGGTPRLLISQPITLDDGRKLYQVQMKTSLKYNAILDQARLRIITY